MVLEGLSLRLLLEANNNLSLRLARLHQGLILIIRGGTDPIEYKNQLVRPSYNGNKPRIGKMVDFERKASPQIQWGRIGQWTS